MIDLVRLDQVDSLWPKVLPWVEIAIAKAGSLRKAFDIYRMCRHGQAFMAVSWPSKGIEASVDDVCGVIVMLIEEDGEDRVLQHLVYAMDPINSEHLNRRIAYEMVHWPMLEQWGITRVVTEGREGWPRWLKGIVPTLRVVRVVMEWRQADVCSD